MKNIELSNGMIIPNIGFGTWALDEKTVVEPVGNAIECGYRLIDTASYYKNEEGIGKVLEDYRNIRNLICITSKVWTDCREYGKAKKSCEMSMKRLGIDYLDIFLIHWPATESKFKNWKEINAETWSALEDLYSEGKVRAVGVCNFNVKYLEALLETAIIRPMINQIEYHPGFTQNDVVGFCNNNRITVQAWSPFGRGEIFSHPVLKEIAEKSDASVAQICLKWIDTHGICPVVKSSSRERMTKNLGFDKVTLGEDDIKKIDGIPFFGKLGYDLEKVRF